MRTIPPVVPPGSMAEDDPPDIVVDSELRLRPFDPDNTGDVDAVIEAFTTPDIVHWHFRHITERDGARRWITDRETEWAEERAVTWAIVDRPTDHVLGRTTIYTNLTDGYGEVSYWVLPVARGRGVATRACLAATAWAFELGLHRIELQHSTRNDGSRRVAAAAGFQPEGVRRQSNLMDDGWHDMAVNSRLATDPPA